MDNSAIQRKTKTSAKAAEVPTVDPKEYQKIADADMLRGLSVSAKIKASKKSLETRKVSDVQGGAGSDLTLSPMDREAIRQKWPSNTSIEDVYRDIGPGVTNWQRRDISNTQRGMMDIEHGHSMGQSDSQRENLSVENQQPSQSTHDHKEIAGLDKYLASINSSFVNIGYELAESVQNTRKTSMDSNTTKGRIRYLNPDTDINTVDEYEHIWRSSFYGSTGDGILSFADLPSQAVKSICDRLLEPSVINCDREQEDQDPGCFSRMVLPGDDVETVTKRFKGALMSSYTQEDLRTLGTRAFVIGGMSELTTQQKQELEKKLNEEEMGSGRKSSGSMANREIEAQDLMYDPFPEVHLQGYLDKLDRIIKESRVTGLGHDLRQIIRGRSTISLEFSDTETMKDRFERVELCSPLDWDDENEARLLSLEREVGKHCLNETIRSNRSNDGCRSKDESRGVYNRKAMFNTACNKQVPYIERISTCNASTQKKIDESRDAFKRVRDTASETVIRNDQYAINALRKSMKGAVSRKLMYTKLKQAYYLPKNITKKAMQKIIHCALKDIEGSAYDLPSVGEVKKLAESLGYGSIDDFEFAIKEGLKITRLRQLRDVSRPVDEEDRDNNDDSSQGSDDCNSSVDFEADNELQQITQGALRNKLANIVDREGLIGINFDDSLGDPVEDPETLRQGEELIKETELVIRSKHGITYFQFRYNHVYCYKVLSMLWDFMSSARLPFGRTPPNLAYIYIMGLLIDPNNMLGLRYEDKDFLLHLGNLSAIERSLLVPDSPNMDLENLYTGVLSDSKECSSLGGVMGAVLMRLKRLNRFAARLSCLTESVNDAKLMLANGHNRMTDLRKNLLYNDKLVESKAVLANNVTQLVLDSKTHTTYRKELFRALGMGIVDNVGHIDDVKFPYTLNCMAFMRNIYKIFMSTKADESREVSRYQLLCMVEDAVESGEGLMEYLLRTINSQKQEKILKFWFRTTTIAREISTYLLDINRCVQAGLESSSNSRYSNCLLVSTWRDYVYNNNETILIPKGDEYLEDATLGKRFDEYEFNFRREDSSSRMDQEEYNLEV